VGSRAWGRCMRRLVRWGLGSVICSPSGDRGGAPAANDFYALSGSFCAPGTYKNAVRHRGNIFVGVLLSCRPRIRPTSYHTRLQAVNSKSARRQPEMLGCRRLPVRRAARPDGRCQRIQDLDSFVFADKSTNRQ